MIDKETTFGAQGVYSWRPHLEDCMHSVELNVRGIDLDYQHASLLAEEIARQTEKNPEMIAWRDRPQGRMSPVIEGADIEYRWRDYGVSHGGDVIVSVNDDYDFIFIDSSEYETVDPSPYRSVHDGQGHEYLCLPEHLKRAGATPEEAGCTRLDEPLGPSMLHEG